MEFLSWIVLGFIAGALAKLITPGNDPGGCLLTIGLGIAGAAIGGWIGTQIGFGSVTGFDLRSLGLAIAGSMILLALLRIIRKK
ncbi:MAG TPA: GlsB/YeaQ/YmgE family stress response membrane protein [Terrimicrobiaceae bacterium]|nr:GlsB/YeaQ/YmgE family stress response membrane protein [Terrimicrobiaceae bacterium]